MADLVWQPKSHPRTELGSGIGAGQPPRWEGTSCRGRGRAGRGAGRASKIERADVENCKSRTVETYVGVSCRKRSQARKPSGTWAGEGFSRTAVRYRANVRDQSFL